VPFLKHNVVLPSLFSASQYTQKYNTVT